MTQTRGSAIGADTDPRGCLCGSKDTNDAYWAHVMDIMWPISQSHVSCILFMFIEVKFIHCHSCVMFAMKSMSMCND